MYTTAERKAWMSNDFPYKTMDKINYLYPNCDWSILVNGFSGEYNH